MKKNNHSVETNFSLLVFIQVVFSKWLLLILFLLAGAAGGIIFGFQKSLIYQSSATFAVTIDYTQTGALSDVQEDRVMRDIGSILMSDQVIDQTLTNLLEKSSIPSDKNKFLENGSTDREDFRWTIRYQGNQPEMVFTYVDEWSQTAESVIIDAITHAQIAEAYLKILDNLQYCYQNSPVDYVEDHCGFSSIDEILEEIAKISKQIQVEKQSSQGLFYPLSVVLVSSAYLPTEPIRNQFNQLVMSGAFIGFLAGIFFLAIRYMIKGETL